MKTPYPNKIVNLPLGLVKQAFNERFINSLRVFTAAKMATSGYFEVKGEDFERLCQLSGYKKRTVLKHLDYLNLKGWVGKDNKLKRYYVRSWAYLRHTGIFCDRNSVKVTVNDINRFRVLLVASVLTERTQKMKTYNEKHLRERGIRNRKAAKATANTISGFASQVTFAVKPDVPGLIPYYGMSNRGIGRAINFSESRARQLKLLAVGERLIRTRKKYKDTGVRFTFEPNIHHHLKTAYGDDAKKMRLIKVKEGTLTEIKVVEQLHDEIDPNIRLSRINYQKRVKSYLRNKSKSGHLKFKTHQSEKFSLGVGCLEPR